MRSAYIIFLNLITVCVIFMATARPTSAEQETGSCDVVPQSLLHSYGTFGDYIEILENSKANFPEGVVSAFKRHFVNRSNYFDYFRNGTHHLFYENVEMDGRFLFYHPFLDMAVAAKFDQSAYNCNDLKWSDFKFDYFDILPGEVLRGKTLPAIDDPYSDDWFIFAPPTIDKCMPRANELAHKTLLGFKEYDLKSASNMYSENPTQVELVRLHYSIKDKHQIATSSQLMRVLRSFVNELEQQPVEFQNYLKETGYAEVYTLCFDKECKKGIRYDRLADMYNFACTIFDEKTVETSFGTMSISSTLERYKISQ